MVQPVLFHGQQQGFLKFLFVDLPIVDGDFGGSAGIQRVQQFRVVEKHRRLIVLAGDAVVNIGKGEGFGKTAPHLKNPVRPDTLDGDGVLYGLRYGEFLFFCFRCFTERFEYRRPSFPERFLRLLFFPSRWLGIAAFPFAGRLFPLCDGVLHGFIVEAVGFENQLLGREVYVRFGGEVWKPAVVMRQGAGRLPYSLTCLFWLAPCE